MGKRLISVFDRIYRDISRVCIGRKKQAALMLLKNFFIIAIIAYVFYDNFLLIFALLPCFLFLFYEDVKKMEQVDASKLLLQFQDFLELMSQSMQAGSSVENAFSNSYRELRQVYREETQLLTHLGKVVNALHINIPIEKLLMNMADYLEVNEIRLFATVFSGAKRSGGDMVEVISFAVSLLTEKIRIRREIEMIISSKKLEQKIMSFIPMVILLYVRFCCGEFILSMYHSISGVVIMTVLLALYVFAYLWSRKIMDIEV